MNANPFFQKGRTQSPTGESLAKNPRSNRAPQGNRLLKSLVAISSPYLNIHNTVSIGKLASSGASARWAATCTIVANCVLNTNISAVRGQGMTNQDRNAHRPVVGRMTLKANGVGLADRPCIDLFLHILENSLHSRTLDETQENSAVFTEDHLVLVVAHERTTWSEN